MEETAGYQKDEKSRSSSFILPPHKDLMIWSVLITIFCCLIGGIIAIIYSSKSNSAYNSAIVAQDDYAKQSFYNESEQNNRTARTWIIISVVAGVLTSIVSILFFTLGTAASIASFTNF